MRRSPLVTALAAVSLLAVACAGADASPAEVGESLPDRDTPVESPADDEPSGAGEAADEFPTDDAREQARGLLGMFESDLPDDVRVMRRGTELFALTEDYVLGRRTVQLDDDASGFRVMAVTVELPAGPETFFLEAG